MNKMTPELSPAEAKSKDVAYSATERDVAWQSCGEDHWNALPREVQEALRGSKSEILDSRAVVLEVLPPQKRGRIERAINHDRLDNVPIRGTRYTLVRERNGLKSIFTLSPSPSVLDVLRG